MKYEPKTTEWMRRYNWGAEAQQLVTDDLTSCESCLAEAERERDQAWNDAERLRGVMMKYDVSKKEQRDKRWDDMTKRAELNGRSIIEGYYEMNLYAIAKSAEEELATLTQERDALREVTRALIRAGDALYVKGKFADQDYWAPCNWATVVEESDKLLTPSGEAGKGGGV